MGAYYPTCVYCSAYKQMGDMEFYGWAKTQVIWLPCNLERFLQIVNFYWSFIRNKGIEKITKSYVKLKWQLSTFETN